MNDFLIQHPELEQSGSSVVRLLRPWIADTKTLYVATDDPKHFSGVNLGVRVVFWHDLLNNSTGSVLSSMKAKFTEERWFKLTGIVEMLICTYAESFVGTKLSSFSGHIMAMRIHAHAPETRNLFITKRIPVEAINTDIALWKSTEPFVPLPKDQGDPYPVLPS